MNATGLLGREGAAGAVARCDTDEYVMPGGEDEFMRVLYERYRPLLQGYVFRLTRDAHWAEDIVQAALVRAWRTRDQLTRGEPATRGWLFTTAYRIFIDEYRVRSNRPVTMTGEEITAVGTGAGDDEVERVVWSVTLAAALSTLSERHRRVIVHVYYLSRTIDEAADALGIAPGTVKSRLHYGLRALRTQLSTCDQH
jgi:RNA polymerase sigma-70 factor, ECF subfamily